MERHLPLSCRSETATMAAPHQSVPRDRAPAACYADGSGIALRLNANAEIDNLRGYPVELINQLRSLLAGGPDSNQATIYADASRSGFYDLETRDRVFYIYVSPISGKIFLLATWATEKASRQQGPRGLVRIGGSKPE